ncbi:DUF3052 domain-containing protein [Caulobacter sp. 17J65-9]|uniref:DUF3052 domain-containing protein n=1 Tax=Caulobacter sp. 17J65-9 TaxID=2709382 RepID=UPI0013C568AA|nr:DUF3052 domain-containing protein [Caulobacter sp. 17J65-9]NEX93164.1 DUF3052 domain-containing protein [Caulobacter sp. 17J65-9]
MSVAVGYSGKSVIAKLGLKPGQAMGVIDPPPHWRDLAEPLPEGARAAEGGHDLAMVWLFVRNRTALEARIQPALAALASGGALWISWPKKSSKLFVDLTEDGLREVVLPTGWVDVKVCAVDADWSGLKFLRRKT